MDNTLKKEYLVLSSACDAEGKLGIRGIFDLFMDLAAEHAARLKVSYYDMLERRCYWVAVRTRVRIVDRPLLGDHVEIETWPGKPGLAKSDRFYRILRNGVVLAEGRTEWAAQDLDTGTVRRTDSYGYPTELTHREERLCPEPFTRFKNLDKTSCLDEITYRVSSTDIDVGRHMNNVAYVRLLLSTFSVAEQESMDVSEVEISYRRGCFEGEELTVVRERREDGWYFQIQKPDGETAVHGRILLR